MSANILHLRQAIPDDVLIDAARMFYPDVEGVDSGTVCAAALRRLRDMTEVEGIPDSGTIAEWRATDPVCIAYHAMMFLPPQPAGMKQHHPWFDRLRKLRAERQARIFRCNVG